MPSYGTTFRGAQKKTYNWPVNGPDRPPQAGGSIHAHRPPRWRTEMTSGEGRLGLSRWSVAGWRVARSRSTTKATLIASQTNIAEMAKWSTARPRREVWNQTPNGCFGSVLPRRKAAAGSKRSVTAMILDSLFPRLAFLARFRLQRKTKPQRHALDRIRRAPENFRRLFQRSRRLGQLHEPAVFLERPGLARHNRNDPLVDTRDKAAKRPMFGRCPGSR